MLPVCFAGRGDAVPAPPTVLTQPRHLIVRPGRSRAFAAGHGPAICSAAASIRVERLAYTPTYHDQPFCRLPDSP
jgi:hypothetical protein